MVHELTLLLALEEHRPRHVSREQPQYFRESRGANINALLRTAFPSEPIAATVSTAGPIADAAATAVVGPVAGAAATAGPSASAATPTTNARRTMRRDVE